MPGREHAASLVGELGEAIGLAGLKLDDDGYCCLSFDDDVIVNLEHDEIGDRLLFYTWLGPVPSHGREALYERLLDANFFWKGTNGGTLSLDKEREGLVLLDQVPMTALDGQGFQSRLESFLNMAEGWRADLRATGSGREDGASAMSLPAARGHLLGGIWA